MSINTLQTILNQAANALQLYPADSLWIKLIPTVISVFNELIKYPEITAKIKDTPVVIANGQVKLPNFYSVLVDDTKAIRMASDYMFDHGRMDLFYVFDIATDSGRAKRQGFLEAMKLRDVPDGNDRVVIVDESSLEGGRNAAGKILSTGMPVNGVICGEDITAIGLMKEFKEREETSQLLFVAEQYIGKPLSPTEINTILFFSDRLGFSEDLIDYLIQYCVDKGKKDFRYIEKVAVSWAQEGITTPQQASRLAGKYDKAVYTVMNALGKSGTPTKAEAAFALKWAKEYGFTQDIILEACHRTVMATDKHRFEYADRILSNWHGAQVHHKADILALDDAYAKTKASRPSARPLAGNGSPGNNSHANSSFNQFLHTDYDFDALEKEILSN